LQRRVSPMECARCHASLPSGHDGIQDGPDFICSHCIDSEQVVLLVEHGQWMSLPAAIKRLIPEGYHKGPHVGALLRAAASAGRWDAILAIAQLFEEQQLHTYVDQACQEQS